MIRYILKRILIAIPVLIGITLLDYLIMSLAGSPLTMMVGPRVSQAAVEAKAVQLGLTQPFLVQYFTWLSQLLQGNWGYSIKTYQPVLAMIRGNLGPTLLLMGTSLALGFLIAIPVGVYSATHQYKKGDYAAVTLSFLGTSIPSFFLALILVYVFTVRLGWLPSGGMTTLGTGGDVWDVLRHMAMPTLVLTASLAGSNIRYVRSSMLEVLSKDYLRTATAKGIGRRLVVRRHAVRNALLPIITVVSMELPMLIGGAVIVEQVFSWPGLGLLTMTAIMSRDYPVIMGVSLLSAILVLAGNLLADILYAVADPTIQLR